MAREGVEEAVSNESWGRGRNFIIFMWAKPLQGPLEGVGPEMATTEASAIWAQKSQDLQGLPHLLAREIDLINIIKSKRHTL
jgi:hypothetical protein